MLRRAWRAGGIIAIAGGSFLLGARYGNECPLRSAQAATAVSVSQFSDVLCLISFNDSDPLLNLGREDET
ncbi:unnamed protein product [Haemonchus placei]|uniref:Secreted protein n=1 Tax=Haemonchus placei TaxID=6290 RepID=A0A0N4XC32_HAEPC|nr:unnamed protein product [Haemonchus placei]